MSRDATYRGEVLPSVRYLSDVEIAQRIEHASKIDAAVSLAIRSYRDKHAQDAAAVAAASAFQSWADLGFASVIRRGAPERGLDLHAEG